MNPPVVAELLATAIHKVSSESHPDGLKVGGLALVASPEAVAPSGGVVPCQPDILIVIHAAVVPTEAVQVGVVLSSEPSAIL